VGETLVSNTKLDFNKLDSIIKRTIEAINNSKSEIFDIAESARNECKALESEMRQLKEQVKELVKKVAEIEIELQESKRKLMYVNKNFHKFSQEELKQAYEKADNLRIELAVKREQEQYLVKRRNYLEVRIKEAYKTVEKAERLITQVAAVLGYLTGDLQELSLQLEDIKQKQYIGFKIIKSQEEERKRVAREIHDGPAQSMSNVVLKAEICEKLIDVDIEKAKEELRSLKDVVRGSLRDVRRIIYDLRPMSLDDLGLVPTLQRYIATFEDETGINVVFKARGKNENVKSIISLTTFRIIQEAVSNIRKHSQARNAAINIDFYEDCLKLNIYDDGKGFDQDSLKKYGEDINGGFGLVSMRERVELLGGEMHISSRSGIGTRINIVLPLVQKEEDMNEQN
jgi:two-component system sensor histidine kinase DegS